MPTPFAMVSSAKAMVNLPKLSDLTINKSRSMRKSLGRERNRLARFALEEDSHLEGGDSQNAFGKNEEDEEEGKSEKLDEEEGASSSSQSATETTHSNVEASSSKFMALKKDTNNAKTTGGENTNKEQKNIRVARRRVNPATAAAVAKAKRETTVSSKGEENKKENNIEDTDEDEDETHTILVRQPFETSDLELELNDSDAKATTSGGSVKVKTERRVGKSGSKSSKNFIGGKSGANGINANKTKKEREEEDEEEEDEYAVSDWKKWNERFDQLAKEDEALVALNGQLAEAIDVEDYGRASTIRDAIEAALTVDPAMKIRRGFLRALETEDYGAAAKFRDSGAGLLGWWHGVDITDYLQSYSIERDKMHDYAYGVNGDQLVYKQPEREEEEEEEEEGEEAGTKAMKQSPKPPKKFTKGTIVHVTVRRGRLVGTSFTARELADANDESPLDTFKSWAPSASDTPVNGKLDKLKEILDTQYEKYTNKRDEEEKSKEEEGIDAYDVNEEEDAAIKYSVKDQTFGTPYFELHVREEYDKDSKEIKFVTQPARLHYVESFRRIPVVDLNDHADEDGQKITVRRETDDDDGGPETIDDETKKKLLADLQEYKDKLASTKAALSAHEKELATREERIRKLKENLLTNVSLLREEMRKNTSAIDEITLDTDEAAEKRRQERFKLVQEIRDAVIAKGTERIKEEEEELDNVINTIFDAYDQNTTPEDPPSREELIKMLEDYDTLDEYGSGLLNALRADENADVADEDSLFEEEFFERWSGIDRKIRTNSPDFLAKLERFGDDALALGDALFDDADDEDDFDENDDYDDGDFDDFDESNIVESEGGFDSRMKSIEDLYGDPSLYDRVRVPAECTRVSQSSFLLKSEGLSVDTDVLGINAENVKEETEEKHHRSVAASTVRFERIPDHVATQTSKDPFDRLYVARLVHTLGEDSNCITGIKLTGDANVPAGAASFRAKIDEENKLPKLTVNGLQTYPEELGVLARYKGQGRVAKPGFEDASWTDGELLVLDGKGGQLTGGAELGFVWAVPHERRLLILFTSLKLPSDLRDDLNNKDNDAVSALSR
ncbi:unnamed protein product [Bathycoccus prasinos]